MAAFLTAVAAAVRIHVDSAAAGLLAPPSLAVPAVQDTVLARLPAGVGAADTVVLKRFAPAPVVQFFLQQSPLVMWGGLVLALVVAVLFLRWIWPRLPSLWAWYKGWSRPAKATFFGAVAVVALSSVFLGYRSYDYIMNDSRFCTGCHIFMPPGQVVEIADTGDYTMVSRLSGKHDTLNCHTCHEFRAMSEARKMVLWMSGFRYTKEGLDKKGAPAHGFVPRNICETCHVQGNAKESWQAIASTAGHRVHLQSDSASGKLLSGSECLTCHAQTAHVFSPTDSTCSQQGCHLTDETRIRLGRMTSASGLHCTVCHAFTADVPALATLDSASRTLRPARQQCLSCHAMEKVLPDFNAAKEPHGGQCGVCHNPHSQATPAAAVKSCASAQCHADWKDNPFHTGKVHRRTAEQCLTCHAPHASRVDPSDCAGCHESVRARTRYRPPVPFDTTRALKRVVMQPGPADDPPRGQGDAPPEDVLSGVFMSGYGVLTPPAADSFPHARHTRLSCIECHTTRDGHGGLTFETPRGCDICHHQAPAASKCAACHSSGEMARALHATLTVAVPRQPPRPREVPFAHQAHARYQCLECHSTPVTMAPAAETASCRNCHENHHESARDCAACHTGYDIRAKHAPEVEASHQRCDACHAARTVRLLEPTRSFCGTCHERQRTGHHPEKECSVCHLLSEPAEWKRRLTTPGP